MADPVVTIVVTTQSSLLILTLSERYPIDRTIAMLIIFPAKNKLDKWFWASDFEKPWDSKLSVTKMVPNWDTTIARILAEEVPVIDITNPASVLSSVQS